MKEFSKMSANAKQHFPEMGKRIKKRRKQKDSLKQYMTTEERPGAAYLSNKIYI
jgi:hypothetical protein